MESGLCKGKLTKWNDKRGFGFIQPEDRSQEIFLHICELKNLTRRPQVGDTIYYHAEKKDGKLRAYNAFILGARDKPSSLSESKSKRISSKAVNKYSFPILEVLLLSILPLIGSLHFAWITVNPIPLILYPVMSLLTFMIYAEDKSRAKRGKWRISEQMLHICEFAGGWLGGFIAQRKRRHKSSKSSYQIVFWAIVTLHIAFWVDWLFCGGTLIKVFFGSNFRR